MRVCKEFLVFGKVQGVGFRRFVKAQVDELNQSKSHDKKLYGHVRNLENGSVRVVAQGYEEDLLPLYEALKIGNAKSKVEGIDVQILAAEELFTDFKILI